MSDEDKRAKQLVARVDRAVALLGQIHDELIAIKRTAEGSNPTGEIFQHFSDLWERRYRAKYTFNGAVDGNHIKRLLKVFDVPTLKARLTRYFADDDSFLLKNRHAFNVFIGRVNNYATPEKGKSPLLADDTPAPVVGCTHTPPCGTDAEHTRRRMGDMRR